MGNRAGRASWAKGQDAQRPGRRGGIGRAWGWSLRSYTLQAWVAKPGQSTQTGECAFGEANRESLEISTGTNVHAEAILGEYFWLLGSLYCLDL